LYKEHGPGGMYRGGPAYYIKKGLGQGWLAAIFAVALIIAFGLIFNAVQSNSIAEAASTATGIDKVWVGIAIAALTGVIIFGGIPQIARVAEFVVPFMAGAYLLAAAWVLITNITEVPGVLGHIIGSAFGLQEAAGGVAGGMMAAMMNGIKRGLFSNEAGMGSAPNIAAVAVPDPHHPASQGFVQALGVFIDTLLVCTATAIMILLSGAIPSDTNTGVVLTQGALTEHFGVIAIAIFFFAFTSIIGNYAYAENAIIFLGHGSPAPVLALRIGVMGMVIWGAIQQVQTVFDFADASMGLMATINLIAIVFLSGTVSYVTQDYLRQRREGKNPTFHLSEHPEIAPGVSKTIWK
ncbi:MAG TPA: alanine/glycine:cation symporter family protein, partial [Paracoccus sp. (in: a-proteobacteria)]|nr:alanine/glycine:cation symporter family protein [Paracoccus sp. (in: a-proteobacteria)]